MGSGGKCERGASICGGGAGRASGWRCVAQPARSARPAPMATRQAMTNAAIRAMRASRSTIASSSRSSALIALLDAPALRGVVVPALRVGVVGGQGEDGAAHTGRGGHDAGVEAVRWIDDEGGRA